MITMIMKKDMNNKGKVTQKQMAALNMPANLENSAVAAGLENVSFHSNLKERQCQRMLKLPLIVLISQASKVMLKIPQAKL